MLPLLDNFDPVLLRSPSEFISAGFPSAAEGYEDEPLDLHKWIVRNPAATFFYRVTGDDLRNEHICDGSIVVVDRSIPPTRGKLVLIEEGGEFAIIRCLGNRPLMVCGVITAVVTKV